MYADSEQRFVNLTPHTIVIEGSAGAQVAIPASGRLARVIERTVAEDAIGGVGVADVRLDEIEGLPSSQPGVWLVVSFAVALAANRAGRTDVLSPDTSVTSAIRDESGQIIAVRRLRRIVV